MVTNGYELVAEEIARYSTLRYCAVPENFHTHPKAGRKVIPRGFQKPKFLKEYMYMKLNQNFKLKNLSWEGYGYFLEQDIDSGLASIVMVLKMFT